MARAGRWLPRPLYDLLQQFISWIVGKALRGQQPPLRLTPWTHLALVLLVLVTSAVASGAIWQAGSLWLLVLPYTMLATTSAARTLFLTNFHACIHGCFSLARDLKRRARVNRLVVDILSLPILTLPYQKFHDSHAIGHHGPTFTSANGDDDANFSVWKMGLRWGLALWRLVQNLIISLLSLRIHVIFLYARLRANVCSAGWCRRFVLLAYIAALVALGTVVCWQTIVIAWVLPLTGLYQLSAMVGFAGEHRWLNEPDPGESRRDWLVKQTWARFIGIRYPDENLPAVVLALAVPAWWAAMLLWYLPLRLFILPGDLSAHDWHHRHPCSRDWVRAKYAREEAITAGETGYTEEWGVLAPILRNLRNISAMPPTNGQPGPTDSDQNTLLGM
jgi:fatty acid desaturase